MPTAGNPVMRTPETRAARIFREVFAQDAHAARHLKPSLDRYLKTVLDDPKSTRSDKTQARKLHADLLRQYAGVEPPVLPEWAKEPKISDEDIQEILTAAEEAPPPLKPVSTRRYPQPR